MNKTYHFSMILEALSPITHMMGVSGNEAMIAAERVNTDDGYRMVPFLSGNALRHRLIREPGGMDLIQRLGMAPVSLQVANALLHGGALTMSSQEHMGRLAELRHFFPLLAVIGLSFPDQIVPGKMSMHRAVLACSENSAVVESYDFGAPIMRTADEWITSYQYTRGDSSKVEGIEKAEDEATSLMIYSGQAVGRGAVFVGGMSLYRVSEIELGAVFHSLNLWAEHCGSIGGMSGRGHGRLKIHIVGHDESFVSSCVSQYLAHIEAIKDEAKAFLLKQFEKPAKPSKKAKQKVSKVDDATDDDSPKTIADFL